MQAERSYKNTAFKGADVRVRCGKATDIDIDLGPIVLTPMRQFVLLFRSESKGLSVTSLIWHASKLISHGRVKLMKKVMEFRAQAKLCRQLAISEPKSRIYWLAEAERWSRLAQDEISAHYEECNVIQLRDAASRPNVMA